jgi:hypothetical protein
MTRGQELGRFEKRFNFEKSLEQDASYTFRLSLNTECRQEWQAKIAWMGVWADIHVISTMRPFLVYNTTWT